MGKHIPDWPRMMKRATACAYCDLSGSEFEREISTGRLPAPVMFGNSEHWSRVAIDASLERLAGEGPIDDWRTRTKLYANA